MTHAETIQLDRGGLAPSPTVTRSLFPHRPKQTHRFTRRGAQDARLDLPGIIQSSFERTDAVMRHLQLAFGRLSHLEYLCA